MHYYSYDRPSGEALAETPARFTWLPKEGVASYRIEVYGQEGGLLWSFREIPISFYTPDVVMPAGEYSYSVFAGEEEIVSRRAFSIRQGAVETPLPPREHRYDGIPRQHPRIWLDTEDISRLAREKDGGLRGVWADFLANAADPWKGKPPHTEPAFYPNHERVVSIWRQMYITCQEALYAVKHCAVAWRVTGGGAYLQTAKDWLLSIAGWDVEGSTARAYNDEAAFRVTTALAWGYDWLHDALSEEERALVKRALLLRGRELYRYVRDEIQIHVKLLDSHGVRSLSLTLVPAALALYGEEPEARDWLDYTIEYYFTIFTPWGGADGGWAEGPAYWQMGVSFFTEAICLIRKASGIDIFRRPFFQHTGDFPLYAYCQDLRSMAFCDMSDLGDPPGLKAGYTMRILSGVSQSENRGLYAWYHEEAKRRRIGTENAFYNYGWWNFSFDELFFRMLSDKAPAAARPEPGVMLRHFRDIGWVCLHRDMADESRHLAFMFKSSPYGCVSHSHGDQNAFVLHAYGEPLAIQSGYYIGFWSEMHLRWRRQTKSKNAVLVDGVGQFADLRKTTKAEELNGSAKSQFESLIASNGRIERCERENGLIRITGDATNAFVQSAAAVNACRRHVLFHEAGGFFVLIDEVELPEERPVQWLLHALSEFQIGANRATLPREKAGLEVLFLNTDMDLTQTDAFDGVPPEETRGLAPQWHLTAATRRPARRHEIITLLYPYPAGEAKALSGGGEDFQIAGKAYRIAREADGYRIMEK